MNNAFALLNTEKKPKIDNNPDLSEAYKFMYEKLISECDWTIIQLVYKHGCLIMINGGKNGTSS